MRQSKIVRISGMFFASTMVMVTVALIMAVIVTNIYAKKESPDHAPDWCVAVVSRFYPANFKLTRKPEVVFVESGNGTVQAKPADDATGSETKRDRRRVELEWKLIAKFADRVFFWVFLALSIIVHAVLFVMMVPRYARK